MILLVDLCYKKDSLSNYEFVRPIAKIVEKNFAVKHYTELVPEEVKKYEKIILCGTALKDNSYLDNLKKFEWLKEVNSPVLGICAGMQVIALTFGSELTEAKEIGMKWIKLVRKNKLFSRDLYVYELHGFGVKPSNEFEVLAESDKCVQAIKHKEKEIYGIMFHPEVRQEEVIRNFLKIQ